MHVQKLTNIKIEGPQEVVGKEFHLRKPASAIGDHRTNQCHVVPSQLSKSVRCAWRPWSSSFAPQYNTITSGFLILLSCPGKFPFCHRITMLILAFENLWHHSFNWCASLLTAALSSANRYRKYFTNAQQRTIFTPCQPTWRLAETNLVRNCQGHSCLHRAKCKLGQLHNQAKRLEKLVAASLFLARIWLTPCVFFNLLLWNSSLQISGTQNFVKLECGSLFSQA